MGAVDGLLTSTELRERLDRIEAALQVRPAWIKGWVNLGRYLGHEDKKGRTAKAWAEAEALPCKLINGVPHFSLRDVDRAMRNGRAIETGEGGKVKRCEGGKVRAA